MRGHVVVGLSLLLAGCVANQGDSEDPADPSLGTLQQGIQCAVTWRDQYHNTGTSCGTTSHSSICGPTAASMMRDAMTCGQCNPTPGQVRAWYDKVNGTANCCPSGTSCPSGPGALPHDLYKTMAHDNGDGCPVYTIEDKCASNYTIDDMKRDLAPEQGYVAVVSGDMMKNKSHCCSCWYSAYSGGAFNHTFYVHQYDAAKDQFAVYDPDADCNSGHKQTSPNYWTAAEMAAVSGGFDTNSSKYLCVLLGKGMQSGNCSGLSKPPTPVPTDPSAGLDFACGNSMRDTGADWSYGYYKGDCSASQAATGLSMSTTSPGYAHDLLCRLDNATAYPHQTCHAVVFDIKTVQGTTSTGDWDPNYFKGECAADEYVASVSQSIDLKLHAIYCCKGQVSHQNCQARVLNGQSAQEDPGPSDWDPNFWKGECGAGRYLAGASHQEGVPHAILCCGDPVQIIMPDAGAPDTGTLEADSGTPPDANGTRTDAANAMPPDAGEAQADAAITAATDAGPRPIAPDTGAKDSNPVAAGCGCVASTGGQVSSWAFALLALALLKARRRSPSERMTRMHAV